MSRNIFSTWSRIFTRRIPHDNLNWIPNFVLKSRYNVVHWDQLLLQDLIEWRISWNTATTMIKDWNDVWSNVKKWSSISEFVQKMLWQDTSLPIKDLRILFENSENINFMSNPSMRKLFFGDPTSNVWENTGGRIWNWFNRKVYTPTNSFSEDIKVLEWFFAWKDGASSLFETLSTKQQSFVKQILESWDFKNMRNLKDLLDNVKNYDLSWLSDVEISRLVWELVDHTDKLWDLWKINQVAQDIHTNPSVVIDRWDTIPDWLSPTAKAIDDDLLYVRENIMGQFDNIDDLPQAARTKVQEIDNFRTALQTMNDTEVDRLSRLLWEFKGPTWWMWDAIEQLTLLRKIQKASVWKVLDTWILDVHWNPITKNFDDIVKNMNGEDLKALCRQLGISDDALEPLAKTFKAINESNVHRLVWTTDEFFEAMCKLMKYFTKLT